jgi:hypothetical protein
MPSTQALQRHLPFLLAGLGVPALAALLEVVDGRWIRFWLLPELILPDVCLSQRWLSVPCPACGLTRSIVFLVHGRLAESLAIHPLGAPMLALIVAQVPYRLWRLAVGEDRFPVSQRIETGLWVTLAALLLLNRAWTLVLPS